MPLIGASAVEVGAAFAAGGGKKLLEMEVAHVVWCATGHDDGGLESATGQAWPVATYWLDWNADAGVPVIAL